MMYLAINASPLISPLTGIGRYTYCLAHELAKIKCGLDVEYFYSYNYSKKLFCPGCETGERIDSLRGIPVLKPYIRKIRNCLASMKLRKFDVYFEPNFIPIKIPAHHRVITVADFSFMTHPECHPKERIDYFKSRFWQRVKTADHVIFISEFIRQYGIESYGFSSENSTVIPLGVNHDQFHVMVPEELSEIRRRLRLPEKFMLFVGSLEPRKNIERMLKAYLSLPLSIRDEYKCVLAGGPGWHNSTIQQFLDENPRDLIWLGYVSDDDLPRLYNLASALLFVSLYEGFGLPTLEAMACGCPVLSSTTTSMPAVCGDAALLVDPHDVEAIRDGMLQLLEDNTLSNRLRSLGLLRAQRFTWEESARAHLDVFNKVS